MEQKLSSPLTDLGEPLLKSLALSHFGEVVVVEGHVGHDGLLVRVREQHVLHLQQLHDAKLPLSHGEGVVQVTAGLFAVEAAVVKEVRPERRSRRKRGGDHGDVSTEKQRDGLGQRQKATKFVCRSVTCARE